MARCYNGKIAHIDLTRGIIAIEEPPEQFYRDYGGGSAMGLYYILKKMPPRADALGPENVLTFFTGVPTGLAVSGQSRLAVNAKSPLSGAIGDSQSGGFAPAALKSSGFDGLVITGKAQTPVYLYLHDGLAEIRNASSLWGLTTEACEARLRTELGDDKIEVVQIGPAGEAQSLIANIINMRSRANGRTGMGAVMGSKNLKAVVLKGGVKIEAADPKGIAALAKLGVKNLEENADVKDLQVNGTAGVVAFQNLYGSLPTRNYNEGQFEDFESIAGDRLTDTLLKDRETCFACVVRCKRVVEAEFMQRAISPEFGGPEYETIATMGSYCGVNDLKAVALASALCNQYGLDTIAAGATIAFAMECFENGLLNREQTGGLDLHFGNTEALVTLVEQMARREGFGAVFADGSARAAQRIGAKAAEFLITVKNTEAPAHMPQAKRTLGLIYAVNPFGADHQSSEHDPMYEEGAADLYLSRLALLGLKDVQPAYALTDEKVRYAYLTELFYSALDSYCLCQFVWGPSWELYGPAELAELLRTAAGWEVSVDEILKVGARRLIMMRAFNAREGFTRADDVLPAKFARPLAGTGPTAGSFVDPAVLEHCKDVYYSLAGLDPISAAPTRQRLAELGLEWIA